MENSNGEHSDGEHSVGHSKEYHSLSYLFHKKSKKKKKSWTQSPSVRLLEESRDPTSISGGAEYSMVEQFISQLKTSETKRQKWKL